MGVRRHTVGRKAVAVVLTLIPGLGHIVLDRHVVGVILFFLFAVSANGAFVVVRLWVHEEQAIWILRLSVIGLLLVYPVAFVSVFRLTFGRDEEARARERQGRMRQGISHYLRGETDEAMSIFRSLLKQDVMDTDCMYYLGMIHRDRGETGKARRMFRRCATVDRKWKWEAAQAMAALRGGSR